MNECIRAFSDNTDFNKIGENVAHVQKWLGLYQKKCEAIKMKGKNSFMEEFGSILKTLNVTMVPKHSFDNPSVIETEKASIMAEWGNDVWEIYPPIVFYSGKSIFTLYKKMSKYAMKIVLKYLKKKHSKLLKNKDLEWTMYERPKYCIKIENEVRIPQRFKEKNEEKDQE